MNEIQKTEREAKLEKAVMKMALSFGTVELNSVMYWHMASVVENEGVL